MTTKGEYEGLLNQAGRGHLLAKTEEVSSIGYPRTLSASWRKASLALAEKDSSALGQGSHLGSGPRLTPTP